MIVKEGFDGLSMHKLAKAAGVSPATIYIYFRDREELILRLYGEVSRNLPAFTLDGFDPGASFREGRKVQWIKRARFCRRHPMEAHFMAQVRFSPLHDRAIRYMHPTVMEAMRAFVKGAIKRNELIRIPVEVYWSVAFAPLYQLVKFHKHGKGMPGTEKFVLDEKTMQLTLELVLKALQP